MPMIMHHTKRRISKPMDWKNVLVFSQREMPISIAMKTTSPWGDSTSMESGLVVILPALGV